jgi:phosphopantetheinyl transferase
MRLSLTYPSLELTDVEQLKLTRFAPVEDYTAIDDAEPESFSDESDFEYSDGETDVMGSYLGALSSFHKQMMDVQQQVLVSYLKNPTDDDESGELPPPTSLESNWIAQSGGITSEPGPHDTLHQTPPFLKDAIIGHTDTTVFARRLLSTKTDLYLLDHAIGGAVSSASGVADKVYLLPLMVALEIMAETGSLLAPGMVPVKLENVWAYRRIRVDEAGFPISVTASPLAAGTNKVLVEMWRDEGALESGRPHSGKSSTPLMSCEIEFGGSYSEAPQAVVRELPDARASRLRAAELYSRNAMFHGPRMRCVRKIEGITDKAISGTVEIKGIDSWFAPANGRESAGPLLLDPNLLDNASQLVLFFLFEKGLPVTALLPFHIESVEFFGPPNPRGGMAAVLARLLSVTDTGTRAHVDIFAPGGALSARITGISSRRITLCERLIDFVHDAPQVTLAERPHSAAGLPNGDNFVLVRLDESLLPEDEVTLDWLTDYLLSAAEREYWLKEMRAKKRKREWLLGRVAAKEAVRTLIRKHTSLQLAPADIEIERAGGGPPSVAGDWLSALGWQPRMSLSHTQGTAVAVASAPLQNANPGVDIEFIRPREAGFEEMLLSDYELSNLKDALANERELSLTRIWCAKEAAGKAIGVGLGGNPHHLVVEHLDRLSGNVSVRIPGCESGPGNRPGQLLVRTFVEGDLLTAITLAEEPSRV